MLTLLAAVTCISPLSFGAAPDDGKPDEQALAAAVSAAVARSADVCLPAGVFELGRTAARASLLLDKGPITLRGVGPATVLRMTGNGRMGDWRGVEIGAGAAHVLLEELTIDSLGTFNTEEQTHLVQISAGARKVTLRRVTLGPMRRPDQTVGYGSGGDCVRLLGEATLPVEDVVIASASFVDCDRSGVSVQRGVRRVRISRSTFRGTGDAAIDFEPTSPGPIEDIALVDLDIEQPAASGATWAMTIGGHGQSVATRVEVSGCRIRGGGIGLLNVGEVTIADSEIEHGAAAAPTIMVRRRAELVRIIGNSIVRPAAAPPGALIEAQHNNGVSPTALLVSKNALLQETAAPVVSATSLARLEVTRNSIDYVAGDPRQFVIDTHAIAADAGAVRIADNTIRGVAAAALRLDARSRAVSGVELRGNVAEEVRESVTCELQKGGRIAAMRATGNELGEARTRCAVAPSPEAKPAPAAKPPPLPR